MKKIILLVAIALLVGIFPIYAQDTSSMASGSGVSHSDSTVELVAGGVAIVALGLVIVLMYRNRRKTIGGIQSQSKPSPEPATTQSINNPGSGI